MDAKLGDTFYIGYPYFCRSTFSEVSNPDYITDSGFDMFSELNNTNLDSFNIQFEYTVDSISSLLKYLPKLKIELNNKITLYDSVDKSKMLQGVSGKK